MRFDIDDITDFFMKTSFLLLSIGVFILTVMLLIGLFSVIWEVVSKC